LFRKNLVSRYNSQNAEFRMNFFRWMHIVDTYQYSGSGGSVINWPPGPGSLILNYVYEDKDLDPFRSRSLLSPQNFPFRIPFRN
jgi:hypothetical protein